VAADDGGSRAPSSGSLALSLGAVLFLAAALRLPFLDYGLPGTTYVDAFRFVDEARSIASGDGPFTPQDYVFPGLLKLVLAVVYGAAGVSSRHGLYLAPRILASLADLGTVALVFALARRLAGAYGAVLAAALHAVCVIAVTSARTETADAALTFFLTAALLVLTSAELRPIHFLLGGLFIGCATGTKWSGAYGLCLLPAAAWLHARRGASPARAAGWAAIGGALAAFAVLASTPWLIPRFGLYRRAFEIQADVQRHGQIGHVQSSALDYLVSRAPTWEQPWLGTSLLSTVGLPALAACLAATLAALLGRPRLPGAGSSKERRVLALYVVVYYALVSGEGHVKAIRYLLPVLPALWVLTGAGVADLVARRPARPRIPAGVAEAAAAVLLLAYPAAVTLPYLAAAGRPTTSDLAVAWARASLPRGATVLVSPFYLEGLRQVDLQVVELSGAAEKQYRVDGALGEDTEQKPLFRPELLPSMRRYGIAYVALGSYFEGALSDTEENRRWFPKSVAAYGAFRARLDAEADLALRVRGHAEGRLGPDIEVYRLRPDGTP
jgi:4-amino-4-deoxy-L-arabinose transferase-like glycosyltransferase